MSEERREGGCLCGAVRYSVAWPPLMLITCACRNCQKQSGSALSVVGAVKRDDLQLIGNLTTFHDTGESGQDVYRQFCAQCGSPVLTDTPQAQQTGMIFFKAGTLDETADLAPTAHLWTSSAQGWLDYPEGTPTMQKQEGL